MKVIILGSGSYSGTPKPLCTCENCMRARLNPMYRRTRFSVYVEGILIDPSPDLHYHLERTNKRVKHVLITHAHFDHVFGVPDLQVFKEISFHSNELGIRTAQDLSRLAFGDLMPRGYKWEYETLEFWKEYKIGKAKVIHFPVKHSIEVAGGFLIEINGVRIGVTGDTGPEILNDEKVLDLLRGVDLLIPEMTKKESIPGVHLGVKDSIELAKKVNAEYTVFAHISHSNYSHEVLEKKVREAEIRGEVAKDFTIVEL
ncbi:MBL fold metallo-hydrolase [Pyrococcus kukulkanii]|uniref:ATP-binding protein n=1 Tax=Pyrococcus kukulkanii TaxID=1609559 RepID=A0A127B8V7_9EURY|nr:MBL fold metallo-hydrolase [Pyrococcus kukulkanii]AMM53056.1 ATP-binding protein [Pyrococcus kukulkanii]